MLIKTKDGLNLHLEEAGDGKPVLFIHEFGGNHQSWEPQMRFFARRYRCITYAARGYAPSDIPSSVEAYSQKIAVEDALAVLDGLGIDKAHIVGLSQGAFATAHFGRLYADRALSLTLAGVGSGADREGHEQFKKDAQTTAERIRQHGMANYAQGLTTNPTRSPALMTNVTPSRTGPSGKRFDRLLTFNINGHHLSPTGSRSPRPSERSCCYVDFNIFLKCPDVSRDD